MALTRIQIEAAALQIDSADRNALAETLLLSIGETGRESIDTAWVAEARRRDAVFLAGTRRAKPVDEVIDQFRRQTGA
jgi:hypothetical protein